MFDAKKLLISFWARRCRCRRFRPRPGRRRVQMAKDNPLDGWCAGNRASEPRPAASIAGNALTIGGLAAIAGLGYQAYKNYQAGQAPATLSDRDRRRRRHCRRPAESGFDAGLARWSNEFALVLMRAMIAACQGRWPYRRCRTRAHPRTRSRLPGMARRGGRLHRTGALAARRISMRWLPPRVTEEQRVELYTASRLTIEPDQRAERGYLDLLAGRLGLAGCACRPHRGNGFLRKGQLGSATSRPVAFHRRLAYAMLLIWRSACAI